MLPPETSPIYQLTHPWWRSRHRPPRHLEISRLREALYTAAIHEIHALRQVGRIYNPSQDARFQWADAYLNWSSFHPRPCADLTARASIFFEQILHPCGKDLAAGR